MISALLLRTFLSAKDICAELLHSNISSRLNTSEVTVARIGNYLGPIDVVTILRREVAVIAAYNAYRSLHSAPLQLIECWRGSGYPE